MKLMRTSTKPDSIAAREKRRVKKTAYAPPASEQPSLPTREPRESSRLQRLVPLLQLVKVQVEVKGCFLALVGGLVKLEKLQGEGPPQAWQSPWLSARRFGHRNGLALWNRRHSGQEGLLMPEGSRFKDKALAQGSSPPPSHGSSSVKPLGRLSQTSLDRRSLTALLIASARL